MLAPQERLDIEPECQLDRFARRARRRDDNDATSGAQRDECVVIGREVRVADAAVQRWLGVYCGFSGLITAFASGALTAAAPGAVAETPDTPDLRAGDCSPRASPDMIPGPL